MEGELAFIQEWFESNYANFVTHLERSETIQDYEVIWSNIPLDFYLYQSEMSQLNAPKVYVEKPILENLTCNKLHKGELFYSCLYDYPNWGTVFYEVDGRNKVWLRYNDQNDDEDQMRLAQICYLVIDENSMIEKSYYYSLDKSTDEETFMLDRYTINDEGKVELIVRNGFFDEKESVLPTRTFRFEYSEKRVVIFSQQETLSGNKEVQIYPKIK